MGAKRQLTEYLDIDLEREMWCCHVCGKELVSAREDYAKGCLLYDRDPREIYRPLLEGQPTFSANPDFVHYVEFYCPGCGTLINVQQIAPGHPLTRDIEPEIDSMKKKYLGRQ